MSGEGKAKGFSVTSLISLALSLATLVLVVYILMTSSSSSKRNGYNKEKNLAGELLDNRLYRASIEEYKKILESPGLDDETWANVNYMMGRIYFENLNDYESAAACYIKARTLYPAGSFYDEAGKNLIASLERMGRVVDAKRELDREVDIDSIQAGEKGRTVVARIGNNPIFLSDLDEEIQNLPPEIQKRFLDKQGKLEMLNQLVARQLMYNAALREGMDKDPDLAKRERNLKEELLASKYITEKVLPQVNIDTADVRNFYLANRKEKYGDKAFDDVRTQVLMDYQQEKSQKAFSEYVAKLAAAERVQIFEENIR